jgi:hypothetical protein
MLSGVHAVGQRIIQLDRQTDGPRGIVYTSTPR